jgi:hypothetical protein
VASQQWADDDQLVAALAEALRAERDVPREFIDAGQAAFTWHSIDAELAALTFDSAAETMAAAVRSQEATPRFLTFTAADLTIELEIGQDELIGQIVPPQPGHVDACPARGAALTATIDEVGCFIIRPLPASPFRLHCHGANGVSALTTWITLY